jgi:superfamily II DNA/RNA helicase/RNA polymerase subunit RPABC4/transcription elongation factor Spt4
MADINVLKTYNQIREKYASFVLTTLCRSNKGLRQEIKVLIDKEAILNTDIIISKIPRYKTVSSEEIETVGFSQEMKKYILEDISKGKKPYKHQISAWKEINSGKNYIISSGTSSGKTESFVYPIIDYCIKNPSEGIKAILIYPTKALANNHAKRFGQIIDRVNEIAKTKIKFGLFDAETDDRKRDELNYKSELKTKEDIISGKPDILMTNYAMLERLLIDPKYTTLFLNHKIKFLVLDEIHYYRGSQGIDVSLLIRRAKFHLNLNNAQCIGTSATLGDEKGNSIKDFLYKIFGSNFDEDIVRPEIDNYGQNEISVLLEQPKKLGELIKKSRLSQEKVEDFLEKSDNLRAHIFFQSPPELSRCLGCNHLVKGYAEKCPKCSSSLIFKLLTCRQCGQEYFSYLFNKTANAQNIENLLDPLKRWLQGDIEENRESNELILSKTSPIDPKNYISLKICKSCSALYSKNQNSCADCNSTEFIEVYAPKSKESSVTLNESTNDKYCSFCGFKNQRLHLIASTEISDENCSHIVFEEFYSTLPKGRDKILIFTDGVQRSSKFARELEETHLKKIARAKLERKLLEIKTAINLNNLIFEVINELRDEFPNFKEELIKEIKIELYEEIFSNENKVASLINRGKIKIEYHLKEGLINSEKFIEILKILADKLQIREYYDLMLPRGERVNFQKREELFKNIYRKMNCLQRKRIGDADFFNFSKEIMDFMSKENLVEYDQSTTFYFIKPRLIFVNKGKGEDSDNYYDLNEKEELKLMRTENHTGKTDVSVREQIESEFQKDDSSINILIATPTLELGIDIGVLDSIGLLYAPPSPANYIQRVGRAGRRGSSALSICFLGQRPVDGTYFREPESLVDGKINPPCYKIDLELPLKKSFFSIYLRELLNNTPLKEKLDSGLRYSEYWISKFSEIKNILEENQEKIEANLNEIIFSDSLYQSFNVRTLFNEWLTKLQSQVEIERSTNYSIDENKEMMFSLFKRAGLLPDYAFPTGGVILVRGGYEPPMKGFEIRECCPPSTLDKDKSRYKCERISVSRDAKRLLNPNYYSQCDCGASISFLADTVCQFCGRDLKNRGKLIVDPKVIYVKRSAFSLNKKYVSWDYSLLDPSELLDKNSFISNPDNVEILEYAKGYSESGKNYNKLAPIKICKYCGLFLSDETSTSCIQGKKHEADNFIIGTKFKTRALALDLTNLSKDSRADKTLLNALISALTIKVGCEDGEISGIIPNVHNDKRLILFDNVEGGVGFVDYLKNNPLSVLEEAKKLCEETSCCEMGCVKCIGSYRRQWEIDYLNKKKIIPLLNEMITALKKTESTK